MSHTDESISLDLSPSELSFALSRRYRTKASKRQRLWWRCDAANRPPTRAPAGREPTDEQQAERRAARGADGIGKNESSGKQRSRGGAAARAGQRPLKGHEAYHKAYMEGLEKGIAMATGHATRIPASASSI